MAATPDPELPDYDHPGEHPIMSEPQQYSEEFRCGPDAHDGSYHEESHVQRVPTKTGEEDGAQLDSDRPGSAGTGHSTQLDGEDRRLLETTSANTSQTLERDHQPFKVTRVQRTDPPTEANTSPSFSYAQHTQQPLDFRGFWRTPSSTIPGQPWTGPTESAGVEGDLATAVDRSMQAVDRDVQSAPETRPVDNCLPDAVLSRPRETHAQQIPPPNPKPKSKKKKKSGDKEKSKRNMSLPARRPEEAASEDPRRTLEETGRNIRQTAPVEPDEEHFEDAAENLQPVVDEQAWPTTPPPQIQGQHDQPPKASSPHSQLQGDLDTTVEQYGQREPALEPETEPQYNGLSGQQPLPRLAPQEAQALYDYPPGPMTPYQAPDLIQHDQGGQMAATDLQQMPTMPRPRAAKAKKSSKSSRKTSTPARFMPDNMAVSDSDINDYLQILMYKIREQCQHTVNDITAERDAVQRDLNERLEIMQGLQHELYQTQQDKEDLSAAFDKQKAQLATYEAKVKKFKTFVDGLGRDVDSLKRDANATRRKSEELIVEGDSCKAGREKLIEQMNNCTERSSQLKNEALKVCSETQSELQVATLRINYLDQQLSEKVGLLAEERDRSAQFERRLLTASEPSDNVLRMIKANHDAMLDKLAILEAALENADASTEVYDTLKETLEAVQAVNSHTSTNADAAAETKRLVVALSERLSGIEEQDSSGHLTKQMDDVLAGLKGVADHQEDRVRQEAAYRDAMNGLQQKIRSSDVRVANVEGDLQIVRTRERQVEEENQRLRDEVAAIQSRPSPAGDTQAHLSETRTELHAKVKALDTAKSNLTAKTAELEASRRTTQELEKTMHGLRAKIEELEQARNELAPTKEAADAHLQQEVERVRAESRKHSEEYRAQLQMESQNQLKKLKSDRDRFEKQVTPMKAELADSKKLAHELQKKLADSKAMGEQLEQARKLACSQSKELEDLKSSVRDLQQSANVDATLKEKLSGLSNDLDAAKVKLQQAVEENTSLQKTSEGYLDGLNEANKACEQVKSELAAYRVETGTQMEKLNEGLRDAQEARRRVEAGQEHFRKSCDAAIEDEAAKGRRKVEDLQTRLAQADAELRKEKTDAEAFRSEMEKQWQLETGDHAQKLDDLRGQVEKADAARDEALSSSEKSNEERRALLDEVDVLKQRLAATEERLIKHQESHAKAADLSARLTVPSLGEGLTPSGSSKSVEPTKPRKKVDRNHNTTLDASALPVPDVLRPNSRKAGTSGAAHEPVIEESQAANTQLSGTIEDTGSGRLDFNIFSDDNDTTQIAETLQSQPTTQVVEESQLNSLPSFAAFNKAFSAGHAPEPNRMSSSLSMMDENAAASFGQRAAASYAAPAKPSNLPDQPEADFSIYEDSQEIENQAPSRWHKASAVHSQDIVDWSHEERDKYTFRKRVPQPNSASKLVRDASQSSFGGKHCSSGVQGRAPLRERRLDTPEVRGDTAQFSQRSIGHSSSPAYAQPATSRPTRTYSNTPGVTAKVPSSKVSSQDPRLIGRNLPAVSKRKADTSIVEGYEQARKKRLSAVPSSQPSRFSQRSQQSINDLPSFPTMPANPKGSSSQSRLRTLGGDSSRTPGAKTLSKADEFNTRFSQELGRR